jgi:ubiquinone/menaquinone biosynthesis C-methylase UbiE
MTRTRLGDDAAAFLADAWNTNATIDPLYSILADQEKMGGSWDQEEFFETGRAEIADLARRLSQNGFQLHGSRALDFGCGVGRLTEALAPYFHEVVGVDVSQVMLERARAHSRNSNVSYVLNVAPDLSRFPDSFFDFVLSRLVLQHTGRRLARSYLSEFGRVLCPGGIGQVQVPTGFKNFIGILSALIPQWALRRYSVRKHHVFFTTTRPLRRMVVNRILGEEACKVLDTTPVNASSILRVDAFLFTK